MTHRSKVRLLATELHTHVNICSCIIMYITLSMLLQPPFSWRQYMDFSFNKHIYKCTPILSCSFSQGTLGVVTFSALIYEYRP